MGKKMSYEEVRQYIESYGYKLLSKEYNKSKEKLKLQCPEGHIYFQTFSKFYHQDRRCPACGAKKSASHKKPDYEYVKSYIESKGYTLLSEEYEDNKTKLKLKCPEDHICHISFANFKSNGRRCADCKKKKLSLTHEEVKKYIESIDYVLVSQYENSRKNITVKCPEGHIYDTKISLLKNGKRCPKCYRNRYYKKTRDIKKYVEKEGYALLTEKYDSSYRRIKVKCPKGHTYETAWDNFKQGKRCPECCTSKPEKEIQNFVSSIYDGKIKPNDRDTIINPLTGYSLELDVHILSKQKAIEFNGTYWHSFPERKLCDKIKKEQCEKNNIDLLVIEEENWMGDKEKCLKQIREFIYES